MVTALINHSDHVSISPPAGIRRFAPAAPRPDFSVPVCLLRALPILLPAIVLLG